MKNRYNAVHSGYCSKKDHTNEPHAARCKHYLLGHGIANGTRRCSVNLASSDLKGALFRFIRTIVWGLIPRSVSS